MAVSECCVRGFSWGGTPQGSEVTLGPNAAYKVGTNRHAAVMLIHDLFSWKFPNTRLLADHYAAEADVTVYVPDFYGGETLPTDIVLRGPEGWGEIDVPGFAAKNSRAIREPEILACAQVLRSQYARVGAVGFCFGGWACCRLAAEKAEDGRPLVDCVATAHPSWVTRADIDGISVPVLLMVPQTDHQFGEELRAYAFESLSRKAAVFDYALFPGVVHGFATRGNPKDVVEQKAMVRAKSLAVAWVKHWLHEAED